MSSMLSSNSIPSAARRRLTLSITARLSSTSRRTVMTSSSGEGAAGSTPHQQVLERFVRDALRLRQVLG